MIESGNECKGVVCGEVLKNRNRERWERMWSDFVCARRLPETGETLHNNLPRSGPSRRQHYTEGGRNSTSRKVPCNR